MLGFTGRIAAHRPEGLNSGASIGSVSSRHRTPGATPARQEGLNGTRHAARASACLHLVCLTLLRGCYAIVTAWSQPFRPCTAKEPLDTSVEARAPHPVGPDPPRDCLARPATSHAAIINLRGITAAERDTKSQGNFTLQDKRESQSVRNTLLSRNQPHAEVASPIKPFSY